MKASEGALTREDFVEMWDSYCYSLREFIGLMTHHNDPEQIYLLLNQVCNSVFAHTSAADPTAVCYLGLFLLCFLPPK